MTDNESPLKTYDNYEISGCRRINVAGLPDPNGAFTETCDDADAEFWTLYGHIEGEGVQCIGDFNSREVAETVYYRITGQKFTGSYQANDRIRLMHAAPDLLAYAECEEARRLSLLPTAMGGTGDCQSYMDVFNKHGWNGRDVYGFLEKLRRDAITKATA